MAKLKGPLMSMDARGQLGKTLVFSGWKGIKDVRSFVIPANPKTVGQVTQREFMSEALIKWHSPYLDVKDFSAYNLRASVLSAIMSGYNFFVKCFLFAKKSDFYPVFPYGLTVLVNTGGDITFRVMVSGGIIMQTRYGYKPTVFGALVSLTRIGQTNQFEFSGSGFVVGKYVYFDFIIGNEDYFTISGVYKVLVLS